MLCFYEGQAQCPTGPSPNRTCHQDTNKPNQPPCKKPTAETSLTWKATSQGTQHPSNPLAEEYHTTTSAWPPEVTSFILGVLTFMPFMLLVPWYWAALSGKKKNIYLNNKIEGNVPAFHVYVFLSQCVCFAGAAYLPDHVIIRMA